ncbi:hypothetical protein AHAS_Ahas01G0152500 [Arachis hypogaea]
MRVLCNKGVEYVHHLFFGCDFFGRFSVHGFHLLEGNGRVRDVKGIFLNLD